MRSPWLVLRSKQNQEKGNHDGRWRQESGVEQVSKPGKGEGGRVEKVTTAVGVREGE